MTSGACSASSCRRSRCPRAIADRGHRMFPCQPTPHKCGLIRRRLLRSRSPRTSSGDPCGEGDPMIAGDRLARPASGAFCLCGEHDGERGSRIKTRRRDQRRTTTGQAACATTCWLTEPSSMPAKPPCPRDPTTSRSAPWDMSISTLAGFPLKSRSARPPLVCGAQGPL